MTTDFRLRVDRNEAAPPLPTVLLDWFAGGGGSTIHAGDALTKGLVTPEPALDFLRLAAAVYCADRRTVRPGTWTRSLRVDIPVRDASRWHAVADDLGDTLSFLSGDEWWIDVRPSSEPEADPWSPPDDVVDAVCLFSGGLDSFTGAVDLLAAGRRVCLVSHYESGKAPGAQRVLAQRLREHYGEDRVILRRLFLRPAPIEAGQFRHLPADRESSTRSRSLLFLASGLAVAAGYGPDIPLFIPENGFIGINVPLTAARSGSFSTRTTHPYFMARLGDCVSRLGLSNPIVNPFRLMTKGEILAATADGSAIRRFAGATISCSHPEASRFPKRPQGNCGYCFPCLIRRAAMYHVGLDDPAEYAFDALREHDELSGERGSDLRALIRSLDHEPTASDVLRNGPVAPAEIGSFAGVYERGRREILAWMRAMNPSNHVRRQLPGA